MLAKYAFGFRCACDRNSEPYFLIQGQVLCQFYIRGIPLPPIGEMAEGGLFLGENVRFRRLDGSFGGEGWH